MSAAGGAQRAVPFYCPFCGDEDLRPHEEGHGSWLCSSCRRVFTLKFVGLVFNEADPDQAGRSEQPVTEEEVR